MVRLIMMFILGCVVTQIGFAQTPDLERIREEIAFNADVAAHAVKSEHRLRAHDQMVTLIDTFLMMPGSFQVEMDSIPWISVVKGDGFRMMTWQLRLSDEEYKYGGRIQWEDRAISLSDNRPFFNGISRSSITPSTWYGCIYYKIIPFEREKQDYYILLGFNAENSLLNTKIVEVLDLSGNDPVLGMPVFVNDDGPQSRLIMTYADASTIYLAFDAELNGIVHSHLVNMPGVGPQGEVLPVSDGSLEGWMLKKGNWFYQEEVYDVKMKDPPMTDERKGRKEDKDILGRPIKD